MIYVLALSDNNTQTRWLDNQLTLNSVVALLTTFIKSFMMVPVAAALGQQKWNWFSTKGRKLRDFAVLDEASRGPLGSFRLLFSKLCFRIGAIGALVTILALAFDAFSQQVVEVRYRRVAMSNGTAGPIEQSEVYTSWMESGSNIVIDPRISGLLSIYEGLLNTGQITDPPARCSSADCTWPIVPTLGVCGACTDMTLRLMQRCDPPSNASDILPHYRNKPLCTWTISGVDDFSFAEVRQAPPERMDKSIAFTMSPWAGSNYPVPSTSTNTTLYIWNFLALDLSGSKSPPISAAEWAAWLCLEALSTTLSAGAQTQKTISAWSEATLTMATDLNSSWVNFTNIPSSFPVSPDTTYGFDIGAYLGFQEHVNNSRTPFTVTFANDIITGVSYSQDAMQSLYTITDWDGWMAQFTKSLSIEIRRNVISGVDSGYKGTAFESLPFVHIRWAWLVFPAAMVTASGALLAATVLQTRRMGVRPWNCDVLAVLACGADEDVLTKFAWSEDIEGVEVLLTVEGEKAFMETTGLELD
ncbi:hypothetical protein MBLNU457_7663t1 [Dothideomycetes sp. NU457]